MISVDSAQTIILNAAQPLGLEVEQVPLYTAIGGLLAHSVESVLDFPHWDNSAMDGYAVRYADVADACEDNPIELEVITEIPAGSVPQGSIRSGQAARILTGSMMPEGADTVVMQEWTTRSGDRLHINQSPPQSGHFVRHQGSFYRSGEPLLRSGLRIGGPEIGVLAAAQCLMVPVFKRLRVGVLSTGDELVLPDQVLQPGQIVDSNQIALLALLSQAGFEAIALGSVKDDRSSLKQAMKDGIDRCDVVISSGGVSVGDYDYVEELLDELGGEVLIRSIAIKPGKPLTFATFPEGKLYFGLPGNPVSALVTFWRFVLPGLRKRSGQTSPWSPLFVTAITHQPLQSDGKRESYLWGTILGSGDDLQFCPAMGSGSSGNLVNLAGSTGLAIIPVGKTMAEPGDLISVMLVSGSP
ncbi:MAG: molybdopterin molybdotransferase MoeA [Alkalinema sp. CAN_BIN05]|nr:molybdopterin molybdotransferase MoeA [Alkalinema sp. CAN_BIN05]